MKILPKNTHLGTLIITEVYEFFDGSKLFCARNKLHQNFLCYWCDSADDQSYDGWLYVPVSLRQLELIRRGEVSIKSALEEPEQGIYLVYVYSGKEKDSVDFHSVKEVKEINVDFFPEEDFYVEQDSITFVENSDVNWSHNLRISRKGKSTNPSAESVSALISVWTTIFEGVMNVRSKSQKLYPVYAIPGSFDVKFDSSNHDVASTCLRDIIEILKSDNFNDISKRCYSIGLEVGDLKAFFDAIEYYSVDIEIGPKTFEFTKSHHVECEKVHAWSKALENEVGTVLATNKIPQADEVSNIVKLLELKKNCVPVTQESFGLVDRQIRYYADAAVLLGFLTRNGSLTSRGRYLLEQSTEDEKLALIASSFKMTDCAMSWKTWAGKDALSGVDPATAQEFILNSVPGLQSSTAGRRAKTLSKWLRILKPYL